MERSSPEQSNLLLLVLALLIVVLELLSLLGSLRAVVVAIALLPLAYAALFGPRRVYLPLLALLVVLDTAVTLLWRASGALPAFVLIRALALALIIGAMLELVYRYASRRRLAEIELREQATRYQKLSTLASDFIYSARFDEDGDLVSEWTSDAFTRITGYTPQELGAKGLWSRLFHPDDLDQVLRMVDAARAGHPYVEEFRIVTRSGQVRWLREYGYPERSRDGRRVTRLLGAAQDITERRQAEDRLRQQNAYLAALHETALGLLNRLDTNELLHSIVTRAATLLELRHAFVSLLIPEQDEMEVKVGIGWYEQHIGVTHHANEGATGVVWRTGKPLVIEDYATWEHRSERVPSGAVRGQIVAPLTAEQQVIGIIAMASSQVDRRLGEAELELLSRFAQLASIALHNAQLYEASQQALERRTRAAEALRREQELFIGGPVVVLSRGIDAEMPIRYVSANVAQFGYRPAELTRERRSYAALIHPDDRERVRQEIDACVASGVGALEHEYRLCHADGRMSVVYDYTVIVRDEHGAPTQFDGYVLDITERREAEEARRAFERQMQETQKLESLGLLAGGIAHDFNNLLSAILGNAGLALLDLEGAHPARASVEQIELVARRAADLTRQMLAYAGKGRLEASVQDLNTLIRETAALLHTAIPRMIALEYRLTDEGTPVLVDATQIRQVLMNMIVNASEAIGEQEGAITLTTEVRDLDARDLADARGATEAQPGRFVALSVADTGCGMAPEVLERIFDPFFTTKFTGRGLGLSAALGIARGHGGALQVRSAPGSGSTFTLLLPLDQTAQPSDTSAPHESATGTVPAGETALVADDEPDVLLVTCRMLERLGLRVLTASDGREAVEVFRAHAAEIDIVLLDLMMPAMDGTQALAAIREIRPEIPALLMSGYSANEALERVERLGALAFIQKPFTPDRLRQALLEAIQR